MIFDVRFLIRFLTSLFLLIILQFTAESQRTRRQRTTSTTTNTPNHYFHFEGYDYYDLPKYSRSYNHNTNCDAFHLKCVRHHPTFFYVCGYHVHKRWQNYWSKCFIELENCLHRGMWGKTIEDDIVFFNGEGYNCEKYVRRGGDMFENYWSYGGEEGQKLKRAALRATQKYIDQSKTQTTNSIHQLINTTELTLESLEREISDSLKATAIKK